jgi:hypothetical protein
MIFNSAERLVRAGGGEVPAEGMKSMPRDLTALRASWSSWLSWLVVVITLGGCLGMLVVDLYRESSTKEALAEIQRAGGLYARKDDSRRRPVIAIDLDATIVYDSGVVRRRGPVTDDTLRQVGRFTELEELSLDGARVTDAGLASLRGLKALQRLNLARTTLSDAAVGHLKVLTGLRTIDLRGTRLTPAGASELRRALPRAEIRADPAG